MEDMMRNRRTARHHGLKFQIFCFCALTVIPMSRLICSDPIHIPAPEKLSRILERKLEKYGFKREVYDKSDMTLLIGNAEMGGPGRLDGLGFDRIWFSDFWRTNAARMPVFGPRFSIEGMGPGFDHYSQSLSLKNAIVTTIASSSDTSWKSEIFF